jgi:hypothetical protein
MALAFSVRNVKSHGMGGIKIRLVQVTFDTDYATPGYTVTPANVNLNNKILYFSSAVVGAYLISPTLSGVNAVLQAFVGAAGVNAEAGQGENGLDTLVGMFLVFGY